MVENQKNILDIPHYRLIFFISLAAIISWGAWLLVIFNLDPYSSTKLALSLFFFSLFLALTGTFAIILFLLKKWRADNEIYVKHVIISLRQGFLLSASTIFCLALLMLGLLRIWNGLIIVIIITLIEFYLSGKDELD